MSFVGDGLFLRDDLGFFNLWVCVCMCMCMRMCALEKEAVIH